MSLLTKFKHALLTAGLAVPALFFAAGPAQANPTWGGTGLHQEFFNNFENVWRPVGNCTVLAPCFVPNYDGINDPAGWARAIQPGTLINNPAAAFVVPNPLGVPHPGALGNVRPGDVFAGILNVQEIRNVGVPTWFAALNNQFTGYFAQEVVSIIPAGSVPPLHPLDPLGAPVQYSHITLGAPIVDPFGKLAPSEMIRLYEQTGAGTTPFESNGTVFDDIAKATDGNFWASLGLTTALNPFAGDPSQASLTTGYAYSHIDLTLSLANFSLQEAFLALNLMDISGTYNKGLLYPINDPNEAEIGGTSTPPFSGTCVAILPGTLSGLNTCNHFVGTAELEANPDSKLFGGFSPWAFASNDPFINYIPEPSALALTGLGLLLMASMRRRLYRS